MEYYFAYARTALKYGLKAFNNYNNSKILIPNFICEDVLEPINYNNIDIIYYPLDDNLNPNWKELDLLVSSNVKFILMVNYFGINQNFSKFRSFSKKHNLHLIEDNAHGYGGSINNESLGSIGDFSISSPRKNLNINCGGILKFNNDYKIKIDNIDKYQLKNSNILKRKLKNISFLKEIFKIYRRRPLYENMDTFRGSTLNDFLIDDFSLEYLNSINIKELVKFKQTNFNYWLDFVKKNNLIPVFDKINGNLSPWCFPAYTQNHEESKKWFKWGWKNNINVFSWPTLPIEVIKTNNIALERWKKLICFSLKKF